MLGDGMRMLMRRAFAAHGVTLPTPAFEAACRKFLEVYEATQYKHTRLHLGVAETLCRLHSDGWLIGLASNKPTIPCNGILQRLGIYELFTVVAGGDATTVKKPDGAHLRYALDRMGYHGSEREIAVMVGDHANDVDAARAVGIRAIAVALEVSDTYARTLGADAVVTDFTRLPAVLTDMTQSANDFLVQK
jgi:phosphoglycolate phosphatase